MDVTLKEAIQLILDFRYVPVGYWKDIPIEDPLVCQFIKEGYAALDPEYQEKYVLSNKGADFLHAYIKQISTVFIEFIKQSQLSCADADAIRWFSNIYGLDTETAESLYNYIARILRFMVTNARNIISRKSAGVTILKKLMRNCLLIA